MKIPQYVKNIMETLEKNGFEAYLVGGCVRDIIVDTTPKDWDITTNAKPEQLQQIFPDSIYENRFGTVGIKIKDIIKGEEKTIDVIEVTTYRTESGYSDFRRPDNIVFTDKIEDDLGRRDFTMNAIAIDLKNLKKTKDRAFIDPFNGQKDLKNGLIRAVGDANQRFTEDGLRIIRAIRFAVTLNFKIEVKTLRALKDKSGLIKNIANERIKDEFIKILKSDHPDVGIELMKENNILQHILPEMMVGVGVTQNRHHTYTVFEHLLRSLKYCPSKDYRVRLAAFFHDIAKPQTKKGDGLDSTFYNHEIVGAKMVKKLMQRLTFSNEDVEKVSHLVKSHMFYYNVDEVSEAGVRRLLKKVGPENMKDLMDVRIADRLGSGTPKAKPYKLRHLEYLIDKVSKDPISVKSLKINGETLIKELKMKPGAKFGAILDCLLAEVIEDPAKNTKTYLKKRALELDKEELKILRSKAKEKIEKERESEEEEIKKKYWV